MADTSDARRLAEALAQRDAAVLAGVLAARGVHPGVSWRDCFDAAEALLEPASIDSALAALPRATLQNLARADDVAPGVRGPAQRLALTDGDGRVLAAVSARVQEALRAHPDAFTDTAPTPAPLPAGPAEASAAAQRAAAAVSALGDVILVCTEQPPRTTSTGRVTAADRKRIVDAGVAADATELADLLALAADAGLITHVGAEWLPAPAAQDWVRQDSATRWAAVATAWRDALPPVVRTPSGGFIPPVAWAGALPLDRDWPRRAGVLHRRAHRWGVLGLDDTEPVWAAPLRAGGPPDADGLRAALPAEVTGIYLQADLTAISPGVLRHDLELRLRTMSTRESHAQASTYRFTAQTLSAALTGGQTVESTRAFLRDVSLTGIPQPLDYLITQTAARHGLVRVAAYGTGTRVSSTDAALLRTLTVDRSLRMLRLTADGDRLSSRAGRDAVYWALVDAQYPAAAVDASGMIEPLRRRRAAVSPAPHVDPAAALLPLATRLREAAGADADAAWLSRELDRAVRARTDVVVTVRMPDGAERDFALEPTGLGGGRLRGRERGADVERTVPVRSIVRVRTP